MNIKDPVTLKASATMKMRKTRLPPPPMRCKLSRATPPFHHTYNSQVSNTFTMLRLRLLPSPTASRYPDMALLCHKVSLAPHLEITLVASARTLAPMDMLPRRRHLLPRMVSHTCPIHLCITPIFTPPWHSNAPDNTSSMVIPKLVHREHRPRLCITSTVCLHNRCLPIKARIISSTLTQLPRNKWECPQGLMLQYNKSRRPISQSRVEARCHPHMHQSPRIARPQ